MSSDGCWRRSESPTSMTANLSEKPLGIKTSSRTNSFTGLLALEDSFLNLAVTLDQYAVSSSRCIISRKSSVVSIIGTAFTTELACLKQANTIFEAAISLRRIRDILDTIKSADRLKFCKTDFESAVNYLRRQKFMMADDLMLEIRSVSDDYFNQTFFYKLPADVVKEIFVWLPIDDFSPIPTVCKDWKVLAGSDEVWQTFYRYKFLRHNPDTMPLERGNYQQAFRNRLADPELGDKVEVAWRGKFRLEALDVYQGLAWWVAEIVDKHTSQGKYKIRYPGWESRWDEWVPKSRLRWAVDRNEVAQILPNDVVELWCCGANVPGAWLESRVKKVRNGRYCVGRVLSTGSLWVERDRLRLVKHVINIEGEGQSPAMSDPRSIPAAPVTVPSIDNGRRNNLLDRVRRNNRVGCNMM